MELTELLKPLAGTPQTTTALVVLLLPLLAFFMLFCFGKRLPRHGDWLATGVSAITFILSVYLFTQTWNTATYHTRTTWFSLPSTIVSDFTVGILLDNLTVLMLVIVTFISTLVQLFSVGYMHGDKGYHRYFAYLGLFTFSMLGIVLADNLLLLFVFWELVGLSSYLLIGFWFERPAAVAANKKAFLVNRVGDIGLLLGLFAFYTYFRTFDLEALRTLISTGNWANSNFILSYTLNNQSWLLELSPLLLTLAGLGLFMGCVGKSAQFPLQIWLPDAMQGPTPVSSLIHAATMVAAGVYLLARCYAFFTPDALTVIAIVGAITALLGALAALTQYDIKAVLAFSTISQLGYMVMGMGTGAHDASLFHLTTHAFFKAALFLNAGIIIHAMHRGLYHIHQPATALDPQDIRNMGGLRKAMPVTFYTYLLAAAALVGLPLFSGFLSKDAILSGSWAWAQTMSANGNSLYFIVPVTGFIVVLLTAFYMARHMWFMFFGSFRLPFSVQELRVSAKKEIESVMILPVALLAIFSLGIFFSLNPLSFSTSWVMKDISLRTTTEGALLAERLLQAITAQDEVNHTAHLGIGILSAVLGMAGIGLAISNYKNRTPEALLQAQPKTALARFSYNHFYLDSFFNAAFVKPALWTATTLYRVDKRILDYTLNYGSKWLVVLSKIVGWFDRLVVDGTVWLVGALSKLFGMLGRNLQNGKVQSYYAYSLFGFILIILYIVLF